MGLATNLALSMMCLSFVLMIFGYSTPLFDTISCFQNAQKPILNSTTDSFGQPYSCTQAQFLGLNLYSLINNNMLQIGTTVGIVAAVTVFGSTTVFSIIGLALFGLATLPVDLLVSDIVPQEIKILIGGFYGFGYVVAMISWLKIGGTP